MIQMKRYFQDFFQFSFEDFSRNLRLVFSKSTEKRFIWILDKKNSLTNIAKFRYPAL